jgi:mono/diheme cytochrome c family protein
MLLCSLLPALAGQRHLPWEKNSLARGQGVYRANCVVCHDIDKEKSTKFGPSFYGLFKREKMPLANMKPSREYIQLRVQFGGDLMPAFQGKISDADIAALIDYIASK